MSLIDNLKELCKSEKKKIILPEEAFDLTMNCLNNGIDIWFENTNIKEFWEKHR